MTNKCRFGGGFDRAVIAMDGPGVDGGKLITNDYSNVTAVETAGMWALTYLTGQYAVVENIPSDDTTWGKSIISPLHSKLVEGANGTQPPG